MSKRNDAHYMFAAKINWLNYQLKGASSNIYSASYQISHSESLLKMAPKLSQELMYFVRRAETLSRELALLSEQIAEFNKKPNKYKITEQPSRP